MRQREAEFDNPMRNPTPAAGSGSADSNAQVSRLQLGTTKSTGSATTKSSSTAAAGTIERLCHKITRGKMSTQHSSLHAQDNAEFEALNTTREEALNFPELAQLRKESHFPDDYVPTDRLLLHLAATKSKTLQVTPEMVLPDEELSSQNKYVTGQDSLAMKLYKWAHGEQDIPHNIKKAEMNAVHRKTIAETILLDPDCSLRNWWDVAQMILLLYTAVALPVKVGFGLEDPELWSLDFFLTLAVDIYFLIDIFMSFITCIYDEHGLLITNMRVLIAKYVESWFFIDLLACFPGGYIGYITDRGTATCGEAQDNEHALQMIKMFRLLKLLRLARLKRLMKKYEAKFYELLQRIKAFNQLLMILLVAHVLACCWHFVGTIDELEGTGWVTNWVSSRNDLFPSYVNGSMCAVVENNLLDLYIGNYYQAISTMIAGSIPRTFDQSTAAELIFSLFALVAGAYVYGSIIGNITELARQANAETDIADQVQHEARAICRGRVDTFLTKRIMQQIQFHLESHPATDIIAFLRSLPGELEQEFAAQVGWIPRRLHGMAQQGLLYKVPFFNPLDNRSKILICARMKVSLYLEYLKDSPKPETLSTPITVEGTASADFYVIQSGEVMVEQSFREIGILEQGHFFGEYNILLPQRLGSWGQLQSRTTYAVNGECEVCALGYEDFQSLRRERPEINEAVLPYIKESIGHEFTMHRWIYIEMKSASDLRSSDASTFESRGLSDPYCKVYFNHSFIGRTPIHFATLNPTWGHTVAIARSAVAELCAADGDVSVRFEVYDYDAVKDDDFLGCVETTLTQLSQLEDFSQFGPAAADVESTLALRDWLPHEKERSASSHNLTQGVQHSMHNLQAKCAELRAKKPSTGFDANLGTITVVLCNIDHSTHIAFRLKESSNLADLKRRKRLQAQRHIHLTHEAAAVERLQNDVEDLTTKVAAIDEKLDTIVALLSNSHD